MILYEYPCNERVRAFLRVEHLFHRFSYFLKGDDPQLHQVAITTLFEILDICERSDMRGMVLQDIERQRAALVALREHPGVAGQRLEAMLSELHTVAQGVAGHGRLGQSLKENEWLNSLRGRCAVPGGCSQVEIPSYYAWQRKTAEQRRSDLTQWADTFTPLHAALSLILQMLRDAGTPAEQVAIEGKYQEMLSGKSFQLLRVWVDPALQVFPEMSANKYVIWVRFYEQDNDNRPLSASQDIAFQLARCNIG